MTAKIQCADCGKKLESIDGWHVFSLIEQLDPVTMMIFPGRKTPGALVFCKKCSKNVRETLIGNGILVESE